MVIFHSYVSLPEGNNSDYLWLAVIRLQFREAAAKTAYPLQQLDDVRRLGPTVFFLGGSSKKTERSGKCHENYYGLLYTTYYYMMIIIIMEYGLNWYRLIT